MHPDPHPQKDLPELTRSAALLRLLLPVVVVIFGAGIAVWLMQSGPKAKPKPTVRNAVAVDVRPVAFGLQSTRIDIMGTVRPKDEVVLKPLVTGKVLSISESLVPGGSFAKGDVLLSIDPSDYRLAVQQLSSEVARVEADYRIERGRQRVAQKEYELLGEAVSPEEQALILREPQLENLKAILDGARARLEQAQLDLERTVVRAPFNAVVMTREVNVGTSVSPATTLATLVGSDAYWIEAPIPARQIRWIKAGQAGDVSGAPARIFDTAAWGPGPYRTGRTIGLTASVEEQGRMAGLLVEVPDPLALAKDSQDQPSLLLGSYVRVEIEGKTLPRAAKIERELVRDGDRVWIMDAQDHLDIRPVEISFRGRDHVLVTGGLREGERLVTSNLPSPVQGMALRVMGADTAAPDPGSAAKP